MRDENARPPIDQISGAGQELTETADETKWSVPRGLRLRRAAAQRLIPLPCGHADSWLCRPWCARRWRRG